MRPFIHTQQTGALTGRKLFTPHDRKEQISRAPMLRLMHPPHARAAHRPCPGQDNERLGHEQQTVRRRRRITPEPGTNEHHRRTAQVSRLIEHHSRKAARILDSARAGA